MEEAYMGFLSDVLGGGGGLGGGLLGAATGFALGGPVGAAIGFGLGGSVGGGMAAAESAEKAGEVQAEAAALGIDEQRRQFNIAMERLSPYQQAGVGAIQRLQPIEAAGAQAVQQLSPYAAAGAPAIEAQQALAGLRGPAAQRAAIDQLAASPEFKGLVEQGERALLQRASATGGLRGGNVQEALAQFRPQMLSQLIGQQYERLGGLTDIGRVTSQNLAQLGSQATTNIAQLGQSAAAGQATGALQSAEMVSGLLGERGAAQAGAAMAPAQAFQQTFGNLLGLGGTYVGGKALGVF